MWKKGKLEFIKDARKESVQPVCARTHCASKCPIHLAIDRFRYFSFSFRRGGGQECSAIESLRAPCNLNRKDGHFIVDWIVIYRYFSSDEAVATVNSLWTFHAKGVIIHVTFARLILYNVSRRPAYFRCAQFCCGLWRKRLQESRVLTS